MLLSTVVFLCVSLAAAQNRRCDCVSYLYCNTTQIVHNECEYMMEVCCDLGSPEPTAVEKPLPRHPQQPASTGSICGTRGPEPPPIDLRLMTNFGEGNTDTYFGEFPWMVAITKVNKLGQSFLCGGSIIYPNLILTAAHSISGVDVRDLRVKAGVWDILDETEKSKHQNRLVVQKVEHSGFDSAMIANDYAVLVLNESLTISDNVAPVCLPSQQTPINTTNCLAIGWGADDQGMQRILKKVNLPLINFAICQCHLENAGFEPGFSLHNSFICAGDGKSDTYVGDGGGPLMCATVDDPNRFIQVGITSWGVGCAQGYPGVYSSVEAGAEWIERQAEAFPIPVIEETTPHSLPIYFE